MSLIDIKQGSDEWHAVRLGRVTASRVSDVVARVKTGWGASRATYMAQLIAERLTGVPCETFTNAAMAHGVATEPEARAAYSFRADAEVTEVGFVEHPAISMAGASPDGFVHPDGLLEIKCPTISTHIETLLGGKVPDKYVMQCLFQMACTGRAWCDYISYDPRMPEHMRLFVKRIPRDDDRIAQLEKDVLGFLSELDDKLDNLNRLYAQDNTTAAAA